MSIPYAGIIVNNAVSPTTELPIPVFTTQEWAQLIWQKGLTSALAQGIYYDFSFDTSGFGIVTVWLSDVFDSPLGVWSVLAGTLLGCAVLALELWPLLIWLGTEFEKTDLSDVTSGG